MKRNIPPLRQKLLLIVIGCLLAFTVAAPLPLLVKGVLLQALVLALCLVLYMNEPDVPDE